jgi:hypothetical protein
MRIYVMKDSGPLWPVGWTTGLNFRYDAQPWSLSAVYAKGLNDAHSYLLHLL